MNKKAASRGARSSNARVKKSANFGSKYQKGAPRSEGLNKTIYPPHSHPYLSRPLPALQRVVSKRKAPIVTPVDKLERVVGGGIVDWMFRLPVKFMVNFELPSPQYLPEIKVDSEEYREMLSVLRVGDVILCGVRDSFLHSMVYIGDNHVVHALAQDGEDRKLNVFDKMVKVAMDLSGRIPLIRRCKSIPSYLGAFPTSMSTGLGVVCEPLDVYMQRSPRDNLIVMRARGLNESDEMKVRQCALNQVGKPYDHAFSGQDDKRFYCAKLVIKSLNAVRTPPRFDTYMWNVIGPVRRAVFRNHELVSSKDMECVFKSKYYDSSPFGLEHPVKVCLW